MNIQKRNVINCSEWDKTVQETYGKIYCLQQQDGCMERQTITITIPDEDYNEEMYDEIPEEINGTYMGVKFEKWLSRDINQPVGNYASEWEIALFWERNFYPDLQTVANDLHKKGIIEKGEYDIKIDW